MGLDFDVPRREVSAGGVHAIIVAGRDELLPQAARTYRTLGRVDAGEELESKSAVAGRFLESTSPPSSGPYAGRHHYLVSSGKPHQVEASEPRFPGETRQNPLTGWIASSTDTRSLGKWLQRSRERPAQPTKARSTVAREMIMTTQFAQLGLPDPLVRALAERGLHETFPIQEATIPSCLAGDDVCGMAPTGSGKTLAFGLPMLARVGNAASRRPRALVLAPTRELAEQIKHELAPLAKTVGRTIVAVYGGVGYGPQKSALNRGVDVLVATPGRLEDLIEQRSLSLADVDIAVVDEADRMADMGFLPAVRRILDKTSPQRQTHLFSATLDGDVAVLVDRYQHNPVRYEAENVEETPEVRHHFWLVDHQDRVKHTAKAVQAMGRSIVFTRTRHGADRLVRQLGKEGVESVAMHGGRSQSQRNRALQAFQSGRARALVATDVAARGIHVESVEAVIHFDAAGDHKDFVHRSGRTGRAGAEGTVISLVTRENRKTMGQIQRALKMDVDFEPPRLEDLGKVVGDRPAQRRRETRPTAAESGVVQSLYVGNLPWSTTKDDLDRIFSRHGSVVRSEIMTKGGRSRGYGFVEMPSDSARGAVAALHSTKLAGRPMVVRPARESSRA
ncbi:MAG TPA: DEAD/DEAH box helicase [Acidimicrobiia bacterium]|nr:DEAD/DEAH box helicase [Acidimicrobiia bacterium]